ncbi:MAG: hypothetical protein VKK80_07275 [Prochlorothrix sp.]|nr:hypothetical protein [Prochlorothrix sp.]
MLNTVRYWHIHLLLACFSIFLISALFHKRKRLLALQTELAFAGIIVAAAFVQSLLWDNWGTHLGFWVFNPDKTSALDLLGNHLPLEEVLWIVHHALIAIFCQALVFDLLPSRSATPTPRHYPPIVIVGVYLLLGLISLYGVYAILLSHHSHLQISGLVALFFGPVFILQWFLGYPFLRPHHLPLSLGTLIPSLYTFAADSLAQSLGIWRFSPNYTLQFQFFGLQPDVFSIYFATTLACTLTYTIVRAILDTHPLAIKTIANSPPIANRPRVQDILVRVFITRL